jgi:hypothetical protein
MSEQAKALVQKMVEAGEWPAPALLEEIVTQGQEAAEPLLEILRTRPHGWPAEAPLDHAALLVSALHPPEGLPALLALLSDYPHETGETAAECAAAYGAEAVEPALAITRDAGLSWLPRSLAATLAIRAAGTDRALRAHVAAVLRDLLAQQLTRAAEYTEAEDEEDFDEDYDDFEGATYQEGEGEEEEVPEDESDLAPEDALPAGVDEAKGEFVTPPGSPDDYYQMTTCLVLDLAVLADPEARDLIHQAYQANVVDGWMIGERDVQHYYREGGDKPSAPDPHAPLERYRESYEEHLARERRKPLDILPHPSQARPPMPRYPAEEAPLKPFTHAEKNPGRNEPCWCGSGKKYKDCHMRADRK